MTQRATRLIENVSAIYPTAVGSLPYTDPATACRTILTFFKDIPFWPQLTRRSFLENMYVQYAEKIPGAVVDLQEKKIYVDTGSDTAGETLEVFERFLAEDVDFFSISRERAEGLYAFIDAVGGLPEGHRPRFVKGHSIGPVSFGLTVTDGKKRALFYDQTQRELLTKILSMRARWQIRKLKETRAPVIFFIDEPYLASIGSSYVSLKKEEALSALDEMIRAVHQEGALCGIHCCGNTDWPFILAMDVDIVNFDAYAFYEGLSLYPGEVAAFLKRGGVLAWGVVPTTRELLDVDERAIGARFEEALLVFEKKGIPRQEMLRSALITPSCGLGSLDEACVEGVVRRLNAVTGTIQAMR